MQAGKVVLPVMAALLLAGCVPSLQPLYTPEKLVFESALVGTWREKDNNNTWTIGKAGENAYEVVYMERGAPGKFEVHLVKLGDHLFIDFYPQEPDIRNDFYKGHLLRVHTFGKVKVDGDVLRIAMLDPDWLQPL